LALVVSALGLAPDLGDVVYGAVAVLASLIAATFAVDAARRIAADRSPLNRLRGMKSVLGFLVPAAYAVGGVLVLSGAAAAGTAVFAFGALLSIVVALMISWIVLVEVLR
jgi:hypothetical protein